jgi:hypothetical protein
MIEGSFKDSSLIGACSFSNMVAYSTTTVLYVRPQLDMHIMVIVAYLWVNTQCNCTCEKHTIPHCHQSKHMLAMYSEVKSRRHTIGNNC